uniref:Surface antigen protein n=2 Tax=root TaxID=1 RepID=A0A075GSC3_9ARCH|nr:surface antigen protein [uncultured marine thaumarchaeote KM3_175_E11]
MAKWADYLISQVLYDQNHIITKVKQHRDIGNKISGGEIVDRDALANNLGHGVKYMTVYGDLGKIRMGKNVRYFRAYEDHYIRIDDNKVMTDNLGELPGLVESQQEEQPVLAEAKPKPAVETKPLSELSSAFFSEQVEQEPKPAAVETEVTPEPAAVETEVTPEPASCGDRGNTEPAAVETEVTPEPAAVETEVAPKETKKKVMKTKSPTKKKPTKKKSVTKKKPTKKKSVTKKKPTKKKSVTKKKPTKKKSVTKKKPTKKKRA